jgi:hypothetical protein
MSDSPKLPRWRYFNRSRRHAGAVIEIRDANGELLDSEQLVAAVARFPVYSPAGPLKAGSVIIAQPSTLAAVGEHVVIMGPVPIPRAKISRPTPGKADGGSAEAEARGGRTPPH